MTAASPPPLLANKLARRRPLISLTPLIDVVFILLVFFMLASSLQQYRSITLAAPADTAGQPTADDLIVVTVLASAVRIDAEEMTIDRALARLKPAQSGPNAPHLLLQPAPGVTLQRTVTVLDALNGVARRDVSLINASR